LYFSKMKISEVLAITLLADHNWALFEGFN
jgi:hypothetical protein